MVALPGSNFRSASAQLATGCSHFCCVKSLPTFRYHLWASVWLAWLCRYRFRDRFKPICTQKRSSKTRGGFRIVGGSKRRRSEKAYLSRTAWKVWLFASFYSMTKAGRHHRRRHDRLQYLDSVLEIELKQNQWLKPFCKNCRLVVVADLTVLAVVW